MILIVTLYALCASTFTISNTILDYVKPSFFISIRMFIAGAILLLYAYWKNKSAFIVAKNDRWVFTPIILFHVYFAYVINLWSLQHITSSESSFLYSLYPFLTALFSYFYVSGKMTPKKWLGLFIGFSGFLPEMFFHTASTSLWISFPEFLLLVAVISGVYGWITLRKIVKDKNYSPLVVNGIGMTAGGILAFFTSFFVQKWAESTAIEFWPFLKFALLIMLVGNIIFYNFYGFLFKQYTVIFLSFAGFIIPLCTAFFGWMYLGELISWTYFLLIFVVCIGVYTLYHEIITFKNHGKFSYSPYRMIVKN